jgi:predicted aspartyl protease
MGLRSLLLACAAIALAAPLGAQTTTSVFEAVSQPPAPAKTTEETGTKIKTRTDEHQRMTVSVRLADAGPFRFLVDTGADRTSISRQLVELLKLRSGQPAQLHSVTGSSLVPTATIEGLRITADPLSAFDGAVLERDNMGADGILALDSLRSQRILFDFRNNSMRVLPTRERNYRDEPGTIVVRAKQRYGRLVLSHARADGLGVTLILDTGSEITIGNAALKAKLERRTGHPGDKVEIQSVTGEMLPGEYRFLRKLEFGGVDLQNLAVVFADAHTFKALGLEDKPAILLGMNAMRAFDSVLIDFAAKKLRVRVPDNGLRPTARMAGWASRSGLIRSKPQIAE